jgi:TolB-like protein
MMKTLTITRSRTSVSRHFRVFLLACLVLIGTALSAETHAKEDALPSMAILYFDYTGTDAQLTVLRKGLAQMLISHIQHRSSKVQIVERERIEDIFKELELSKSDKVDPATAAKIGKLIGARFLVVGSFFDLFGTLRVDARMVEVETGKILTSVGKDGPMADFFSLEGALVDDLVGALDGLDLSQSSGAQEGKNAVPPPARKTATATRTPKPQPKSVQTATVVEYSKALDAMDRGDVAAATTHAKNVAAAQPEFDLLDLDSLLQ